MDLANNSSKEEKDAITSELMKFKLFGTGVDDEGLKEFHSEHFTYPLFKDDGLVIRMSSSASVGSSCTMDIRT